MYIVVIVGLIFHALSYWTIPEFADVKNFFGTYVIMAYICILYAVCLSWSKIISNCDENHYKIDKTITRIVIIKTVIIFAIFTAALIVAHAYRPAFFIAMVFALLAIVADVICLIAICIICAVSFKKVLKNSKIKDHKILKRKVYNHIFY